MTYSAYGVSLTDGEKQSLLAAVRAGRAVTLRVSHPQLSGPDLLMSRMASDVAGCEAYAPGHGMPTVVFIPVLWLASIMTRTVNEVFILLALVRCVEHFGHKGHRVLLSSILFE